MTCACTVAYDMYAYDVIYDMIYLYDIVAYDMYRLYDTIFGGAFLLPFISHQHRSMSMYSDSMCVVRIHLWPNEQGDVMSYKHVR